MELLNPSYNLWFHKGNRRLLNLYFYPQASALPPGNRHNELVAHAASPVGTHVQHLPMAPNRYAVTRLNLALVASVEFAVQNVHTTLNCAFADAQYIQSYVFALVTVGDKFTRIPLLVLVC